MRSKVDDARIGAGAGGDHLRLRLHRQLLQRVVVDPLVLLADAVVDDLVELAGEIRRMTVGEVAAVGEVHGQDPVAGIEHGEIDRGVRLGAGVRLHVGVVGAEKLPDAVEGELLDDIDVLASAVPAAARDNLRRICSSDTLPWASRTAREVKFSEAISSMVSRSTRRFCLAHHVRNRRVVRRQRLRSRIQLPDPARVATALEVGGRGTRRGWRCRFPVGWSSRTGRGRWRHCGSG